MRIIYEDDDGGVVILEPSAWALANGWKLEQILAKDIPEGKSFETIENSEISSDRTYRDAWKKNGAKIEINMAKARQIHMDRIREVRNKELDKSDKALVREMESGGNLTNLRVARQKLRDIPQTMDLESAQTTDELKAKWPDDLPRPSI